MTGRPLVALPQIAGQTDSEIFRGARVQSGGVWSGEAGGQELLAPTSLSCGRVRRPARLLTEQGRLLPGAEGGGTTAELPA